MRRNRTNLKPFSNHPFKKSDQNAQSRMVCMFKDNREDDSIKNKFFGGEESQYTGKSFFAKSSKKNMFKGLSKRSNIASKKDLGKSKHPQSNNKAVLKKK